MKRIIVLALSLMLALNVMSMSFTGRSVQASTGESLVTPSDFIEESRESPMVTSSDCNEKSAEENLPVPTASGSDVKNTVSCSDAPLEVSKSDAVSSSDLQPRFSDSDTFSGSDLPSIDLSIYAMAKATSEVASGTCGDNLTWSLDSDGTLTISGTGDMYDFSWLEEDGGPLEPWSSYKSLITSIVTESGVTSIGDCAFSYCPNLISASLSDTVTKLDPSNVFDGCKNFREITVNSGNTAYCSLDGVLFDRMRRELVMCPDGKTGSYSIPDGVEVIGKRAFYNCGFLTDITLPETLITIEPYAFEQCFDLSSMVIPNSVVSIGSGAFYNCSGILSFTVGNSVTDTGYNIWGEGEGLYIEVLYFDGTEEEFSASPFCEISEYYGVPVEFTVITDPSVFGDNLRWEMDSEGTLTISGTGAMPDWDNFSDTPWYESRYDISTVDIGDGVTSVGANAFGDCTIDYLIIPDSVTSVGDSAFSSSGWINHLCFLGTENEWNAIDIGDDNENLINTAVNYLGQRIVSISAEATCKLIDRSDGWYFDSSSMEWCYSGCDPEKTRPKLTITYADGTTDSCGYYEIYDKTGCFLNLSIDDDNAPLGVGKHTARAELMNLSCEFEFEIIKNPVERISVRASNALTENSDGSFDYEYDWSTDELIGSYFVYNISKCLPVLTVYYKDNTIREYSYNEVYGKTGYSLELEGVQSYENQWGVGTHTVMANFMGASCEFDVEVESNNISGISAMATYKLIEGVHGGTYDADQGYELYNLFCTRPKITVHFNDNTSVVAEIDEFPDISFEDDQTADTPWTVGKHTVTLSVLGKSCTYEVEVIENQYTGISISGDKELYITFTEADGTTETHKVINIDSRLGDEGFVGGNIITDGGSFWGNIYFRADVDNLATYYGKDITLTIGEFTSNTLDYCSWMEAFFECTWPGNIDLILGNFSHSSEYTGTVTKDNIDDVITVSIYRNKLYYQHSGKTLYSDENGTYYLADVSFINDIVNNSFRIDNVVDYTEASLYDTESDKIKVYIAEGYGGSMTAMSLLYMGDGTWHYTASSDWTGDINVLIDDRYRITYYDIDQTSGNVFDVKMSGKCGDNLTWVLSENRSTLTVIGTGDMYDYTDVNAPWYQSQTEITSVELPYGITSIGNYAFAECTEITDVYFDGTEEEWESVTVGKGNESFLNAAFHFRAPYELTADPESSQPENTGITLTAVGCREGSTYKFYDGSGNIIRDIGLSANCIWTPDAAGDYVVYCDITDKIGTFVKTLSMNYTVTEAEEDGFIVDNETGDNIDAGAEPDDDFSCVDENNNPIDVSGLKLIIGNVEENIKKTVLEAIERYNEEFDAQQSYYAMYDIYLVDKHSNAKVEVVDGRIKITLKVPDNFPASSKDYTFHMFHFRDDGTVEEIPITLINGNSHYYFYADEFSPYVLTAIDSTGADDTDVKGESDLKDPQTGDNSNLALIMMLCINCAILAAASSVGGVKSLVRKHLRNR